MGKGRDKRKKAKEEKTGGRNKAKNDKKQKEKNLEKQGRRLRNLDSDSENEDNVELMLAQYRQAEKKKKEVIIEDCARPPPRINATFTANPANPNEVILFGGEYWNGERTDSYNDVYRYDTVKKTWKTVTSPCTPSPRSAHQTIGFKNYLVTFGGEFTSPSQSQFYHHKDLWRLDTNTWQWEECKVKDKSAPQPRSGHRMILWKRTPLMFGGFHDTLTSNGYYFDDVWAIDNVDRTPSWRRVDTTGDTPSKRSAVCLSVYADSLFCYGGFSVEGKERKGITHSDFYVLNLASCTWSKIKKAGIPPTIRSGLTCAVSARKAYFFGGVMDFDEKNATKSRFYSDMFVFNLENRRWFPLMLKKKKAVGARRKKKGDADDTATTSLADNLKNLADNDSDSDMDSGDEGGTLWDNSMPSLPKAKKKVKKVAEKQQRKKQGANPAKAAEAVANTKTGLEINKSGPKAANVEEEGDVAPQGVPIYLGTQIIGYEEPAPMPERVATPEPLVAFIPAEEYSGSKPGHIFAVGAQGLGYYEDLPEAVEEGFLEGLIAARAVSFKDTTEGEDGATSPLASRAKRTYTENDAGQLTPCGRFSTQLCTVGNFLYLYGGQFEDGSREVTLNDMYRINTNTLETFEVLEEMDLAEQEWYESEDDDDDGEIKTTKRKKKKKDEDEDDEEEEESEEEEDEEEEEDDEAEEKETKKKKQPKATTKGKVRSKRDQLKQQLGAEDGVPCPEPHEPQRDFYNRTLGFWIAEAKSASDMPSDRTAADADKAFRKDAFRFCSVRYREVWKFINSFRFGLEPRERERFVQKKEFFHKSCSQSVRDECRLYLP